jgi:hypothetical protein
LATYLEDPHRLQKEPRTRAGRVNWTLRWLGILVPLFLTYPVLPFVPVEGTWWPARFITAVGFWIALTAALLWRRDWRGAAAISAFYIIMDAWWAPFALFGFPN